MAKNNKKILENEALGKAFIFPVFALDLSPNSGQCHL
jgi:hypothetical protein